MKTASKVFVVIGMIIGCILIFPVVVGYFALSKLDEANKSSELKSIGVLTLLFCSQIGGIIMLCIKDKDLIENKNNAKQDQIDNEEANIFVEDDYQDDKECYYKDENKSSGGGIKVCNIIQIPIIIFICILSFIADYKYFSAYFPLIIITIIVILYIINLCLLFNGNKEYNNLNKMIDVIIFILSLVLVVGSIVVNLEYAYIWDYDYRYSYCRGDSTELWAVAVLGIGLFITSIVKLGLYNNESSEDYYGQRTDSENQELVYVKPTPIIKEEQSRQVEPKITNKMEIELNEAKRLYDIKVITKTEYDKIRESIISKYYK